MEETNYSQNPDEDHTDGDKGLLAIDEDAERWGVNDTWRQRFGYFDGPFRKGDIGNPDEALWNVGASMTFWLGKLAYQMYNSSEYVREPNKHFTGMTIDYWEEAEFYYGPSDVGRKHSDSVRKRFNYYQGISYDKRRK